MATKITPVQRSTGHSIGITAGNAISGELDVVTGYMAARDPLLIEARKAKNLEVRAQLTAELLADLAK
jgi:hypothetical protein